MEDKIYVASVSVNKVCLLMKVVLVVVKYYFEVRLLFYKF